MEDLCYEAKKLAWDLGAKIYDDGSKCIVYMHGRIFEFSEIKKAIKFLEFVKEEVEKHGKN
ncbi:MAG: hypothetical protein JHC31_03380 [Sulfurihydrogenibium sp.]|jgi:hypothetical protein|nr:hypothetical protein [Sulfurihydrogenibium sp.]